MKAGPTTADPLDDLVSAADYARILGISREAVRQRLDHPAAPDPVKVFNSRWRLYSRAELDVFMAALPGKKPAGPCPRCGAPWPKKGNYRCPGCGVSQYEAYPEHRNKVKAQQRARQELVRRHFDEYQALYQEYANGNGQ